MNPSQKKRGQSRCCASLEPDFGRGIDLDDEEDDDDDEIDRHAAMP